MSCGLEFPARFIIGSNRHCSSVMETQLTVHHHSINNWNLSKVWESVGYEVLWSQYGSCQLYIWSLWSFKCWIKDLVESFYAKELLIIAKAIPWIPEPAFLSLISFTSVKSCWVLLYSGFVDPCCRWASWADLFWIVLHDSCTLWWRWEVNVWPLGRAISLCVLYYIIMPLHYFVL